MTLLLAITSPSHAYMLSIRGPSLAATVPSRPPISPKMSDQYIMSQNDKHLNPHITRLMMVRGGDEDSSDGDSYSDTDDEVEATVDTSEQSKPTQNEIEVAQRQIALSSQSRNFGIATALWSSLFFDSILNKSKRQYLFPAISEGASTINLVPTALLASGFALASCVSFVLWRDFDVRSEMKDDNDDGEDVKKGDWFLSLSCFNGKESSQFASQIRMRLYFHLALFGALNLCAHAGCYFTERAPFLGLSAAAINGHNTLAAASALLKESSASDLVMTVFNGPLSLFRAGEEDTSGSLDVISLLFRLSAIAFLVRCIPVGKSVVLLAQGLLAGADPTSVINNSRQLSLGIASLGRLTLAAGVSQVLFSSRAKSLAERMCKHPFFAVLSGACSLICFGTGCSLLFQSLGYGLQASSILSTTLSFDGVLLSLMGVVLGYNSAIGIAAAVNELKK